MNIKDLKIGDYFKLSPNGKVYVRGKFERISKRYSYFDFNDYSKEHFCKGSRVVIIDLDDDDFNH